MKKTQIRRRNPNSGDNFPDSGDISLRSGENLTGFDEISQDPVKISLDLREMSPESGFLRRILENSCLILENSHRKLEILAGIWKFWPDSGKFLPETGNSCRDLEILAGFWKILTGNWKYLPGSGNFGRNLEIFRSVRVFQEENRNRSAGIGFWW